MTSFFLKVALSFLVGGLWITLTTVAAERLGSRVGGFIGGLPSTVVVALSSITWTQGARRAHQATTSLPLAFAVNALFLIVYALCVRKGLVVGIAGALVAWFVLQSGVVLWDASSLALSLLVWAVVLLGAYQIATRALDIPSSEGIERPAKPSLVWRGIFSGSIVALAVTLSEVGGPVLGAVLSAFPAVYTSTLVVTSRSMGTDFSRSLIVPLMVSASVNCVIFGIVFRYLVLDLGLVAAAVAYVATMPGAYLTYRFLRDERR
ncbi:MAG: hypothetical protein R6V13_00825 [Anaerolineae bacterium]